MAEKFRNYNWLSVLGMLSIVLGCGSIVFSVFTTTVSMIFVGLILLSQGIFQIADSYKSRAASGFYLDLLGGITACTMGWVLMTHPRLGAETITLLAAFGFFVWGAFRCVAAAMTRFPHWGWMFLGGLLSTLMGIMLFSQWPSSGLWFIGLCIGLESIFRGIAWVSLGSVASRASNAFHKAA